MPIAGDGLHDPGRAVDHRGAHLLPHDGDPVRADGHAGVAWLLPEDSTDRLLLRACCEDSVGSPVYGRTDLADRFRTAESLCFRRPLG